MAPSDGMENINPQGEAHEMSMTAENGESNPFGQVNNHEAFHRYLELPFELRAQIRALAIKAAIPTSGYIHHREDSLGCFRLASVSREWQDDVEKALFSKIRVDPLDKEEVSEFEQLFTDRRKKFLTQLEVAVDDDEETGLWEGRMGLLEISQFMEKTGQLFQQLSGWNFSKDGNKKPSIDVIFTSLGHALGVHTEKYDDPLMGTSSLWEENGLNKATYNGLVPTNVTLWAIKSEFPSSLNIVTHLTFVPDCVPVAAAKRIIQVMPNLETCTFETCFGCESEEGWRDFTDFIHQLRASAPSLRKLRLDNHNLGSPPDIVPASMARFAAALRDFSQSLECLYAWPIELHEAFFLPFSENAGPTVSVSHFAWPKLQHYTLRGFCELPSSGPGQATLSPVDILTAAGRAALAMPNLKSATISTPGGGYFYFERELLNGSDRFRNSLLCLSGFCEDEEQTVLAAWAPLIGAEATLVREIECHHLPPLRHFKNSTQGNAGSLGF